MNRVIQTVAITPQERDDINAAKSVFQVLCRYYPGHPWSVSADVHAGIASVFLLYDDPLTKQGFGYLLHLGNLDMGSGVRKIKTAGGELLERYNLPRRGATDQTKARALQNGLDVSNQIQ